MLEHHVKLRELTVVVADDHPGVVGHLRGLLSAVDGIRVVAEAADGREAIALALRHRPDVLVLDLRLGEGDGVQAIREVLRVAPGMAVLVFTACDDDDSVLTAMRAGVRGYLLKCASDADIVRAVRGVAAGEAIFGSDVAARVIDLLARPRDRAPLPALTVREHELLDLIADGLGNAAIAARLRLAPKTVRNLTSSLVTKLGVADRNAVRRVRPVGGCR